MKKTYFVILFISLLTGSCSNPSNDLNLPIQEIQATEMKLDSAELFYVEDLFIHKNILITLNSKQEKYFAFFNTKGEFLGRAGQKGNGPNDYMNLTYRTFDSYKNQIVGIEASSNQLHFLELDRQDNGRLALNNKRVSQIPLRTQYINDAVLLNDTILVGQSNGDLLKRDLFKFNFHNDEVSEFGPTREAASFPNTDRLKSYELNFKKMVKNPVNNRFAVLNTKFNKITIYDEYLKKMFERNLGSDLEKLQSEGFTDFAERKNYNLSVKSSEKYILGLTLGLTNGEIASYDTKQLSEIKPLIYVWSWEGEPMAILKLDRPISKICLHSQTSTIYGINPYVSDKIYKYEIPEINTN